MSAVLSNCGTYRYLLKRKTKCQLRWIKTMYFVMLNPSTADAEADDPTIRRCIAFAEREACTDLVVLNLFALRATDPSDLTLAAEPNGPSNDSFLEHELAKAHRFGHPVVAAWGAHKFARNRAKDVALKYGPFLCLGKTKDGSPRHPLYLKADSQLTEWVPNA